MRRTGRRAAVAAPVAALAVVLAGCSSDGIGTVKDDKGFRACVEKAGADLDGSGDWDEKDQLAFWSKPGTLDCALDELDEDQLEDALAGGFRNPDKSDLDDARSAQLTVLADWAMAAGRDHETDDATRRAGLLMDSLWVDDDDPDARAAGNGMEQVMAFSLYVAYYGEPAGLRDYLANDTGNVDDPNDQVQHFIDRMRDSSGDGAEQRTEWDRMDALIQAIEDAESD